jgi:hypothetical protein
VSKDIHPLYILPYLPLLTYLVMVCAHHG